ncbi:MAG TPA: hypothetical protein VF940_31155 [Streptosporangiaceae bacterium]
MAAAPTRAAPYTGQGFVLGLVWGWGDQVVLAADRFRADRARIATPRGGSRAQPAPGPARTARSAVRVP